MEKTILSRLLPTGQFGKSIKGLMLLLVMMFTTQGAWAVYSGTPEKPQQISAENYAKYGLSSAESVTYNGYYAISSAEELYGFATIVNDSTDGNSANAILTDNILVNDTTKGVWKSWGTTAPKHSWTPIGNYTTPYQGTFNGRGHTIAGLYHSSEDDCVGLFGLLLNTSESKICNVGVLASYLKGQNSVGGVCGMCGGGIITNCYSTASVSAIGDYARAGGVCGKNYGTISNCYSIATVSASGDNAYAGRVCGGSNRLLSNCYYLNDTDDGNGGKTKDQFRSGEVAWLLQGDQKEDVWGQNIGTDTIPVFGGKKVYTAGGCLNKPVLSNNVNEKIAIYHSCNSPYDKGFNTCTICKHEVYEIPNQTNGIYQIANAGQLYWFAALVNGGSSSANAILTADILVNDTTKGVWKSWGTTAPKRSWTPIGNEYMRSYIGTFNGKGHTIAGLYHSSEDNLVGLFGYTHQIDKNVGKIDSVGVLASYLKGNDYVGGVCGENGGIVSDCYSTATVSASGNNAYVGGVCGYNYGIISNCYSTGAVSASGDNAYVGGVCGDNHGILYNCYSTGAVSASINNASVGGVCGYNNGTLCNCYSIATVSASGDNASVGGVCGYNNKTLNNCYSTATVSASGDNSYVGGVCGNNWDILSNCYCVNGTQICGDGDATDCVQKTRNQFKSGVVADLLQQWVEANKASYQNDNNITLSDWGQKIGTDNSPVLGGQKVYAIGGCPVAHTYSNTQPTGPVTLSHDYDHQTGFCTYCDAAFEPAKPVYASDGTTVDYYEIANAGQLYWFATLVNDSNKTDANAILTADIVVNNTTDWEKWDDGAKDSLRAWTPIGNGAGYAGTFNGKGHTIAGLYHSSEDFYVALFGYIFGKIDSVGVLASYLKGNDYVGGVCGYNFATISNCYSTASVSASGNNASVGGVCGANDGTISNCYSTGAVSASRDHSLVGGVCGSNDGTISNCYSIATMSASGNDSYVGGVCGYNFATISNCFCKVGVDVYGHDDFGTVTNCIQKTRDQFKSGEVAYLLQQWVEANRDSLSKLNVALSDWGQKIDTDTIPMFSSDTVYAYINCIGNAAYTNNKELDGTSGSHEYTALIPSVNPVVDGLYSMVCKHNHDHKILNKRVIKNFDGIHNLELIYEEGKGYANNLYVEQVSLTDGNDLNIPVAFTAKEINYNRVADKDIMTIIFPCDVPANKVNGEAYLLSKYDGDKTLLYKKAEDMKANTPYLINGQNRTEANKSKQLIGTLTNVTVNPTTKENLNKVTDATGKATQKGSYVKETIKCTDAYDFYAFSGEKFMRATEDITTTGHRAFIELEKNSRITKSTRTNGLNIVFEDDDNAETVTSVEIFDVEVIDAVSEFGAKVNVYDIAGRAIRLNVPIENALNGLRNGIYIVNGKKVLVSEK